MLKIWKQTWKKGDTTRRPQSEHDSDAQGASLSGTSRDGSPKASVATVPLTTDDASLGPFLPRGRRGATKRTRTSEVADEELGDGARKRLKLEDEETNSIKDTLGNHLPEVIAAEAVVRPETPPLRRATLEEAIFDQAQVENTVAMFTSLHATSKIVADYLTWAVDLENSLPESETLKHRRTALLVTNDASSINIRLTSLEIECSLAVSASPKPIQNVSEWSSLRYNDVLVMSASSLLDSLKAETASMLHIHTLVIGDAQNVKDHETHPVIKIFNDFYRLVDVAHRPKIFATVISPEGRKFHFDSGMLKLESALDAKVFGISEEKRTELLALPDRPTEMIVLYSAALRTSDTRLCKQLHQLDPEEALFRRQFKAARYALAEVGSCASDLVWRNAVKDIEATISPTYEEDEGDKGQSGLSREHARVAVRDAVKNWAFSMPNLDPSSRGYNVTPKFAKLVQVLKSCRSYGETFRGIVFVHTRAVALVILDILHTLHEGLSFLRPLALTNQGKSADIELQRDVFQRFAQGTVNLLIVTKSAEDLDIPKASVVIRYDLLESQSSDAFVRARTRGRESHLLFMVERGNDMHRGILAESTQLNAEMQAWTDRLFQDSGSSVPPRSLRETTNAYHSDSDDDDDDCIEDPTTGGRIYLQDAITVTYRLAAGLGTANDDQPDPALFEFEESWHASGTSPTYVCTVVFPPGAPLSKFSGPSCASISQARRTACYHVCLELFNRNVLDYRLFPLPTNITSPRDNTAMPTSTKDETIVVGLPDSQTDPKPIGIHCYPRKQPDFWKLKDNTNCDRLYPTIISTTYLADPQKPYGPMLILTRQPLPPLPSFKVFFSGMPATIHLTQGASFEVEGERLEDLHGYTLRVCRAILNKAFTCELEKMQYFFAPLATSWKVPKNNQHKQWKFPNIFEHIPWELVTLAANSWVVPLSSRNHRAMTKDMDDAVIQDRWVEFTRRYDVVCIRPDLTPMSKPLDSDRESKYANLVEYCKARRKGFEGLQRYDQPLLEVSRVPVVLNHLNPTSRPATSSARMPAKYLIPELCAKFTIPASTFRTALLLPSIMQRINDFLLVKELNARFFEHSILEQPLFAAISAPAAGVEFDYERLELLGDAFLKYLSSIYVFVTNPAQKEGILHVHRQRIISNRSLLQNASRSGLPQYIQSRPFSFKMWQPPNFCVQSNFSCDREPQAEEDPSGSVPPGAAEQEEKPEKPGSPLPVREGGEAPAEVPKSKRKSKKKKQMDDLNVQWLGDKAVADVAEAIIGAAYISGGREAALKVTKALNIPVPNIDRWSDFGRKALAPPPNVTAKLREGSVQAVESIIGHKFSRPHLLAQALTHASIKGHETTSYERLEFIGDAILDFMVIRHIFDRDTQLSPGGLTLLKGAMVSNSALAAVCVWSGLQKHLLFESYILAGSIQVYADELNAKQAAEYALAEKEGRPPGQYWLDIEPPKALSDVVESIIGAIYISEDFSPTGAEAVFDNVLKPFYDRHVTLKTLSHHPTKILFELLQAQGCQLFEIVKEKDEEGQLTCCSVVVHDVVLASAYDSTSAFAARHASESALDALEGDAHFMTRTCDCRAHVQTRRAQKKKVMKEVLSGFAEDEEDDLFAVEGVLGLHEDDVEEGEVV